MPSSTSTTGFDIDGRFVPAVIDVSFSVSAGETLGLVGESGSGKSLTAFSIMRLVEPPGRIDAGRVTYKGRDLRPLSEREMQDVRGGEIALIFQEPMTALNPVFTIGSQIAETLRVHGRATRRTRAGARSSSSTRSAFPNPARRIREYPHQLSGGLRQRALIAIALACKPSLVIADEPTTALDVTIQAQILDLLRDLQRRMGLALLLITHDLGVVAEMADRVAVMYAGRIVEEAPVGDPVRGSEAPVHARPDGLDARRRTRHAPARHPGHGAAARPAAGRLRLRAALPGPLRAVPEGAAGRHAAGHGRAVKCFCTARPSSGQSTIRPT